MDLGVAEGVPYLMSGVALTSIDQNTFDQCDTMEGVMPMSEKMFRVIRDSFDNTKSGHSGSVAIDNDDLKVTSVEFAINRGQYFRFMKKLLGLGPEARLMMVYHGTSELKMRKIMQQGFLLSKLGSTTGSLGWYGKGIYFARRAFTALYYNRDNPYLLCSLVSVNKIRILEDEPDANVTGASNPYNGKKPAPGFDAHLSPGGRCFCCYSDFRFTWRYPSTLSTSHFNFNFHELHNYLDKSA